MDNQLMAQIAMAYAASQYGRPVSAGSLGAGFGGNPFEYQESAMLTPQEDSFFGPLGNIAAQFIPGLTAMNDSGQRVPILRTNFTTKPSGMTAYQSAMNRINQRAVNGAIGAQNSGMAAGWNRMFAPGSTLGNAMDAMAPGMGSAVLGMLGSPAVAQFAMPMVNQMLGYDRGVGANIANKWSNPMAAAYIARQGRFGQVDPFGDEFQNLREAFASNVSGGVQSAMYDGIVKKASMHGASENLVSQIMADAFQSGAADKLLASQGLDVGSAAKEREDINAKITEASRGRAEQEKNLREARKYGDEAGVKAAQSEIDKYDAEIKTLTGNLDSLNKKIGQAMEPLISSVTGVVDSLKDFYGSESEAKDALDRLTGGMGSRDKATADKLNDQLLDLKVLGAMAGLDPRMTGQFLQGNLQQFSGSVGSNLANGSAYQGSTAMAFTKDFIQQLGAAGGDPVKARQLMEAQNESMAAFGQSRGYGATVALEFARKSGIFEGNDELYQQLYKMMGSGDSNQLTKAIKMLGQAGWGSEDMLKRVLKDPSQVAAMAATFNKEEADRAGEHGAMMRRNDLARMQQRGAYQSMGQMQYGALRDSGVSAKEIDSRLDEAGFKGMMNALDEIAQDEKSSDADQQAAAAAKKNFQREYEVALEKTKDEQHPNGDPERARHDALRAFRTKGYAKGLSQDAQDRLFKGYNESKLEAMNKMDFFEGGDKVQDGMLSLPDDGSATKGGKGRPSVFQLIGAAEADNSGITKSAFTKSLNNIFTAASKMGDTLTDKNGKAIDQETLKAKTEEVRKLYQEGKYAEARDVTQKFYDSLGDSSKQYIVDQSKGDVYRTRGVIEKQQKADSLIRKHLGNAATGKFMGGLSRDNQIVYAQMLDEMKEHPVDSTMLSQAKESLLKKMSGEDARSDMEKAFSLFQEGKGDEALKLLKNHGVSDEDFFGLMKNIAEGGGGLVVGAGRAMDNALSEASTSEEGRANFLMGDTTNQSDRLFNMTSGQAAKRLDVLRGGKAGSKSYLKNLEKARGGDRKAYLEALATEDKALADNEAALENRLRTAKTPEEKASILAQLKGVRHQRGAIAGEKKEWGEGDEAALDKKFKEKQEQAREAQSKRRDAIAAQDMDMEGRWGMAGDADSSRSYLEALAGGEVSDKEAESYRKDLEKAKAGDRKAYIRSVKTEDAALAKREAALQKEVENAKTPEEKAAKEKQLKVIQGKRAGLQKDIDAKDKMSDAKFREGQKDLRVKEQRDATAALLGGSASFDDRMAGGEGAKAYLELLGGGKVSDKELSAYQGNMEKAQKGDRRAYLKGLGSESDLLAKQEKEIREKIGKASSQEEKEALTDRLMGVTSQQDKLKKETERVSGLSDKDFKKEVEKKREERDKDAERDRKYGGLGDGIKEVCKLLDKIYSAVNQDRGHR